MSRKQRPHLHVVLSTTSTFNVSKIIQQHSIVFSVTLFSARFEMCNNSRYRHHQELLLTPPPPPPKNPQKTPKAKSTDFERRTCKLLYISCPRFENAVPRTPRCIKVNERTLWRTLIIIRKQLLTRVPRKSLHF